MKLKPNVKYDFWTWVINHISISRDAISHLIPTSALIHIHIWWNWWLKRGRIKTTSTERLGTDNKFTHYSLYKNIYLLISWFWYLLFSIVYKNAPPDKYWEQTINKYIYWKINICAYFPVTELQSNEIFLRYHDNWCYYFVIGHIWHQVAASRMPPPANTNIYMQSLDTWGVNVWWSRDKSIILPKQRQYIFKQMLKDDHRYAPTFLMHWNTFVKKLIIHTWAFHEYTFTFEQGKMYLSERTFLKDK